MSIRIKSLYVYSHSGKIRAVPFHDGLNVITGDSKTGKSAIIDMIDYCFGRQSCYVAEGVIRKHTSWFSVLITNNSDSLFIARRNPGPGVDTSPDIFIQRGDLSNPPPHEDLVKNITLEGLVRLVTRFSGIAENEHRPLLGTRHPLQATIRHALFFCFQKQDEIDNRDRLFHRQGEDFIPQAIKDTLPYFLGAVDEQHFLRQNQLDLARDNLRKLEIQVARTQSQKETNLTRLRRFISDAKRVGIISTNFEPVNIDSAIDALKNAAEIDLTSKTYIPDFGEAINRLRDEQTTLRELLSNNAEETRATRLFMSDQNDYVKETTEHESRLTSLELYKTSTLDGSICPVCDSKIGLPTPSLQQLTNSLNEIKQQLGFVGRETPHLQQHLEALEKTRNELERSLVESQNTLNRALAENERSRAKRDMMIERAQVLGRTMAFLESLTPDEDSPDFQKQIEDAKRKILALESAVDPEAVEQKVDTFLSIISTKMLEYSRRLDLEHGGSSLRLDVKNLTVVADTEDGPIPLNKMGSGENWVGYHVLTCLALHWWFRKRNRPVPSLLVFDQPSQAHYPAERDQDGRLDPLDDKDRKAVRDLFKLMFDASLELGENFQLIVLDHVHLSDQWFEDSIIEEWRHGQALVPTEWLS